MFGNKIKTSPPPSIVCFLSSLSLNYFYFKSNGHINLVDVTTFLGYFSLASAIMMHTYGDRKNSLPSVYSFGDFVAFQGPPELAALGISSLHIPLVALVLFIHYLSAFARALASKQQNGTKGYTHTLLYIYIYVYIFFGFYHKVTAKR